MLLLEVMTGEETFDTGNAKTQVFAVPCKIFNSFDREFVIDHAARSGDVPVQIQNRGAPISAYQETFRDDLGKWATSSYRVSEGMIFKVWTRRGAMHGGQCVTASQYIRMRDGAAYREIKCLLTGHPKARYQHSTIKGCFDLITPEQAKSRGVQVNEVFRSLFDARCVSRLMEFKILQAERESAQIVRERVIQRGAEKVIVRKARKARALKLD